MDKEVRHLDWCELGKFMKVIGFDPLSTYDDVSYPVEIEKVRKLVYPALEYIDRNELPVRLQLVWCDDE